MTGEISSFGWIWLQGYHQWYVKCNDTGMHIALNPIRGMWDIRAEEGLVAGL